LEINLIWGRESFQKIPSLRGCGDFAFRLVLWFQQRREKTSNDFRTREPPRRKEYHRIGVSRALENLNEAVAISRGHEPNADRGRENGDERGKMGIPTKKVPDSGKWSG
jgi:hypothetical protein